MPFSGPGCYHFNIFFVGWKFGLIYLLIFLVAIFCASFFVLTEFYLRVQHNIDGNAKAINEIKNEIKINAENKINEIGRVADEIKKTEANIGDKLNGERELYEEVVDFFDNLLNYLEENKQEVANLGANLGEKADKRNNETDKKIEGLNQKIEESKDSHNKMQNKMVVLLQQILEHQIDKKIEGLNQKIEESKDSHNKMQNKMVVLLQQILEHQEDQTNFLKEEIRKLKNEHPRETPAK